MLMEHQYLDDLKEWIKETDASVFDSSPVTKEELLAKNSEDNPYLENMWCVYQKDVDEYECDPEWAYSDALSEVLNIQYSSNECASQSKSKDEELTSLLNITQHLLNTAPKKNTCTDAENKMYEAMSNLSSSIQEVFAERLTQDAAQQR